MNLGMKLRIIRGERTMRTVASDLGLSVSGLSDVERGRALPGLETLQRLADYYGVTLMDVFRDVRIDNQAVTDKQAENEWRA
jgi:transcriptional regulator with XRE-family HTH domain